jgi:arginase
MTYGRPTLIGLPFDGASSFQRGAASAPPVIREALHSPASNSWAEAGEDVLSRLGDQGDVAFPPSKDPRVLIEDGIRHLLMAGGRPIALGGDHSVTYPIVRAMTHAYPRLTILHFDAHPDLYPEFDGDPYSHACPMARIMEEGLAARLVQVGIRTMNGIQREQARRFGVEVIDMIAWSQGTRPGVDGDVYVSIDVDVFDPAFAPGVSHREPGGLSVRDVLWSLQTIPGRIVGADVVEFNPSADSSGVTAAVCAKLVKELAGRILHEEKAGSDAN